ncbi:hypothetical protein EDB83DRAFT_2321984 [Lactarius deliciosus]|nr:hypothetical protein EDB83DRAFT_2321984 [Lactarius deliciosus]
MATQLRALGCAAAARRVRRFRGKAPTTTVELIAKDHVDPVGPRKARILGAERAIKSTREFRFIGSRATPPVDGVPVTVKVRPGLMREMIVPHSGVEATITESTRTTLPRATTPGSVFTLFGLRIPGVFRMLTYLPRALTRTSSARPKLPLLSSAKKDGASSPPPVAEPFAEAVVTQSPVSPTEQMWARWSRKLKYGIRGSHLPVLRHFEGKAKLTKHTEYNTISCPPCLSEKRQPRVHDTPVKTLIPEKHGYIGRTHAVASAEVDIG